MTLWGIWVSLSSFTRYRVGMGFRGLLSIHVQGPAGLQFSRSPTPFLSPARLGDFCRAGFLWAYRHGVTGRLAAEVVLRSWRGAFRVYLRWTPWAFLVFLGLLSQLSFAYLHSKLKNVVAIFFFCSLCLRASVLFFILYCDCWWGIVLKDRAKCMSSVSFKATVFLKLCYFYLIVRWDAFLRTQDL